MLIKERKWNNLKCSIKQQKAEKVKNKNGNEEQGQQIKNSNIYGSY